MEEIINYTREETVECVHCVYLCHVHTVTVLISTLYVSLKLQCHTLKEYIDQLKSNNSAQLPRDCY
jgi:hypothetical protein